MLRVSGEEQREGGGWKGGRDRGREEDLYISFATTVSLMQFVLSNGCCLINTFRSVCDGSPVPVGCTPTATAPSLARSASARQN